MACLRLVTFFFERPDLSVPRFIARISRSTDLLAAFEYFLLWDFLALDIELSNEIVRATVLEPL